MTWLHFGFKDLLDVLLVAFLLYKSYKVMKRTGTLSIFGGIIAFFASWVLVSQILGMRLLGVIMDKIVSVGFIVLAILFQDELRHFLIAFGSKRGLNFITKLFSKNHQETEQEHKYIAPVVLACMNMTKQRTGALIVIQKNMDLSTYVHTGEMFVAEVNARLIENIFFKNSPMHDGAMIIAHNRIQAAGCILPVAKNSHLPKEMGLRHRSGLGMAQETDALVIIVSEERKKISIAKDGMLRANITTDELREILLGEREL